MSWNICSFARCGRWGHALARFCNESIKELAFTVAVFLNWASSLLLGQHCFQSFLRNTILTLNLVWIPDPHSPWQCRFPELKRSTSLSFQVITGLQVCATTSGTTAKSDCHQPWWWGIQQLHLPAMKGTREKGRQTTCSKSLQTNKQQVCHIHCPLPHATDADSG